jgi:hypothetical protein
MKNVGNNEELSQRTSCFGKLQQNDIEGTKWVCFVLQDGGNIQNGVIICQNA